MKNVIGWTMIHSLWQSLALLAVLKLFLAGIPAQWSRLRHGIALGFLCMAAIGVAMTFRWQYDVAMAGLRGAAESRVFHAAGGPFVSGAATEWMGYALFLGMLERLCPYLTIAWMTGAIYCSARLLYGGHALKRLRGLPGLQTAETEQRLESLRKRMGVSKSVRLIVTDTITEPLTFGWLRAVVVLPFHYVSQAPADQLDMILAHELAHVFRRDYLVNLVQRVLEVVMFFNPFFLGLSRLLRDERECCCDDLAAEVTGGRELMALALTNLKLFTNGVPSLALGAAPSRSAFYSRVQRLIKSPARSFFPMRPVLPGLILAAAVVLLLTRCSRNLVVGNALPVVGDRMEQMLTDNQAGYKEQVFDYAKNGRNHEVFLVRTIHRQDPVYGYIDGRLLSAGELKQVMAAVDELRRMWVAPQSAAGEQTAPVEAAMAEYRKEAALIPAQVKQHELLTKIIERQEYTPEEQKEMADLLHAYAVARKE